MPRRKISFINGEIYHIVLRSVEGIPLFRDDSDYFRAIFGLYEFNDRNPVSIWKRRKARQGRNNRFSKILEQSPRQAPVQGPTLPNFKREKLVDILAFCLMPNHIHLLLQQRVDDGISQFVKKFATGYAMYFNKKYDRTGHLFQGSFRAVYIENDGQLNVVFVYIHANPVSIIFPKYKEVGIDNVEKAMKFLENYKWSSYQDYIGKKNFPSVTERDFLFNIIGSKDQAKEEVRLWLEHKKELKGFEGLTIE